MSLQLAPRVPSVLAAAFCCAVVLAAGPTPGPSSTDARGTRVRATSGTALATSGGPPVAGAHASGASGTVTVLVLFGEATRWDAWNDAGGTEQPAGSSRLAGDGDGPATAGGRFAGLETNRAVGARAAAREAGLAIARRSADVERAVAELGGQVLARYDTAVAGVLATVPVEGLGRLRGVPGVRRVAAAPVAEIELLDSVPGVRADAVARELGLDGSTVTIAVADTGVDYTHATLGGAGDPAAYAAAAAGAERIDDAWQGLPLFPNDKVVAGHDFAGARYSPDCTPQLEAQGACTVTPRPDPDPLDILGHGTAVASVAAGRAAGSVGAGVAPGAELAALKIFGNSNRTNLLIDPIEWAIEANMGDGGRPHVDVLNLSLGQVYGGGLLDEEGPIRRAAEAGMVVVGSIGNWGDTPFVASAPAVAPDVLAVASHAAPGRHFWTAQLEAADAEPMSFGARAVCLQGWAPDPRATLRAPVVHVGRACPAGGSLATPDPLPVDPRGAVALFDMAWGSAGPDCTVDRQARRLQEAGAVAGLIGAGIGLSVASTWDADPTVDMPVWMVNAELETAIEEMAPAGGVTIRLEALPALETDSVVSSFSSRGPGRGATLKPDLSAPGEGVRSAAIGQGSRALSQSGTSLAAPHAAGAAALVWQQARRLGWALEAADVVALLATTADPSGVRVSAARKETPPLSRTGVGALDALAAVRARSVVRAMSGTSLALGMHALASPVTLRRTLSITNLSPVTRSYALSAEFRDPVDARRGLDVALLPQTTVVGPGESRSTTVEFRIDPEDLPEWQLAGGQQVGESDALTDAELDGWVRVADVTDLATTTMRLPFHVLARRASRVAPASVEPSGTLGDAPLQLQNDGPFDGTAELFVLGARDPLDAALPAAADLDAVAVRARPADEGNTLLEFALHARGAYDHPLETYSKVEIDTDRDGAADYLAYTADEAWLAAGEDRNGRVKTGLEPPGGSPFGAPVTRFYAGADLFGRWLTLPILAEDTGLTPGRLVFAYRVTRESVVDRSVGGGSNVDRVPSDGSWIEFDARPGLPCPAAALTVPAGARAYVQLRPPGAESFGLLVLFPNNAPGAGDAVVIGGPPSSAGVAHFPTLLRRAVAGAAEGTSPPSIDRRQPNPPEP